MLANLQQLKFATISKTLRKSINILLRVLLANTWKDIVYMKVNDSHIFIPVNGRHYVELCSAVISE